MKIVKINLYEFEELEHDAKINARQFLPQEFKRMDCDLNWIKDDNLTSEICREYKYFFTYDGKRVREFEEIK